VVRKALGATRRSGYGRGHDRNLDASDCVADDREAYAALLGHREAVGRPLMDVHGVGLEGLRRRLRMWIGMRRRSRHGHEQQEGSRQA
jgi:hypothetical protein